MKPPEKALSDILRDARGRDSTHRIVTLTKKGADRWDGAVVPALKIAFARASGSSLPYPYYEGLPPELQTDLDRDVYDFGVRTAVQGVDYFRGVLKPSALAMSAISDAFLCERFQRVTSEEAKKGVVTQEILACRVNEKLSGFIDEIKISAPLAEVVKSRKSWICAMLPGHNSASFEAVESYKAGICAGGVSLVLQEQRENTLRCG